MKVRFYCLFLLTVCFIITSCKNQDVDTANLNADDAETQIVEQNDMTNESDIIDDSIENIEENDTEEDFSEEDDSEENDLEENDLEENIEFYTVGEDDYGYIDLPSDWVRFVDLSGETGIAYSSPDGTSIITFDIFDLSGLTEEQAEQITTEILAQNVWYNLEDDDVEVLDGAKVVLGDYDSFQVYGVYENDFSMTCIIVCWIFEDDNGIIHYVSAEGPTENITKVVNYVESSYRTENYIKN